MARWNQRTRGGVRLGLLALGVLMGLTLGAIPGLAGIVGLSIRLPFTFDIAPFTAFASSSACIRSSAPSIRCRRFSSAFPERPRPKHPSFVAIRWPTAARLGERSAPPTWHCSWAGSALEPSSPRPWPLAQRWVSTHQGLARGIPPAPLGGGGPRIVISTDPVDARPSRPWPHGRDPSHRTDRPAHRQVLFPEVVMPPLVRLLPLVRGVSRWRVSVRVLHHHLGLRTPVSSSPGPGKWWTALIYTAVTLGLSGSCPRRYRTCCGPEGRFGGGWAFEGTPSMLPFARVSHAR